MKFVIVLVALFGLALAAPATEEAQIVRSESNVNADSYNYAYETSDGKTHSEQGQLKNVGSENEAIEVRGSFSYLAPDGDTYTVTYVANENGFQPSAAHLPVAPIA